MEAINEIPASKPVLLPRIRALQFARLFMILSPVFFMSFLPLFLYATLRRLH
jgi:hypothetical protein